MYTCIRRVYMWEVEPTLYWRVKINGKWTWRVAFCRRHVTDEGVFYIVTPIQPEGDESE